MRNLVATIVVILLIPAVLAGGLYAWAYYSTPALVTEAHNRELVRTAPVVGLKDVSAAQQQQIRSARPLDEALAEVLFFFPGPYQPSALHNLQRSIFAAALDKKLSSDEQLQLFINHADFGPLHSGPTPDKPIIGFAAAAQAYFDKPLQRLDPEQLQALLDSLQHKSIQSAP